LNRFSDLRPPAKNIFLVRRSTPALREISQPELQNKTAGPKAGGEQVVAVNP